MKILILGAGGMIGRMLAQRLITDGTCAGQAISALTLADIGPVEAPDGSGVSIVRGDFCQPGTAAALVAARPDVIFHLAAIVSGEAEADLDLGYRVNLDGTRQLLEAIRSVGEGYCPRLVFTSSIAVFGAPFPAVIGDDFAPQPLTSYGTQKLMGEALIGDFTRKGLVDGVSLRLPTIVVRPGRPNRAASGFFSGIIREPLKGETALLPVADSVEHWIASPRAAVGFLLHAAGLSTEDIGRRRALSLPGLCVSVGEMLATLRRVAGAGVAARVHRKPDAVIAAIVANWPARFDPARAVALGFRGDADFEAILRQHIDDALEGRFVA